ncbi:MAG: choline kinase family protein [Bacilli bacterium]|nr:choline kinase family protein [Bacilli bacterium]
MENEKDLVKSIFGPNARIVDTIMGGMMNKSFLVENEDKRYILYIPTEQANEMVDRNLEKETEDIARDLGITSPSFYFNLKTGVKSRVFIEGNSIDKTSSFDYEKVAALMKKLHSSKTLASKDYNPFVRFEGYEKEAKGFFPELGQEYDELRSLVFSNRKRLENRPLRLCHNDAQKSNIVASNDGYYFIDFEFSANNDPLYDVACFGNGSVEEGYELLRHYKKEELTKDDEEVYFLWRIFVSLQWHDVALVKHARGEGATHGFDFKSVANFFLNNAITAKNCLDSLKD